MCLGDDAAASSDFETADQFAWDEGVGVAVFTVAFGIDQLAGLVWQRFKDAFDLKGFINWITGFHVKYVADLEFQQ